MLTVDEAAHWLGVTPRTVYRYVESGRLRPAVRITIQMGERYLFDLTELMRCDGNRRVGAT